jgi:predicted TIM-barrel fold metal-dependent hydrolase
VLDRFLKLKVGFLEAGVVPAYWMERFDENVTAQIRNGTAQAAAERIHQGPSLLLHLRRRGIGAALVIEQFGDECMMYASDYPAGHGMATTSAKSCAARISRAKPENSRG